MCKSCKKSEEINDILSTPQLPSIYSPVQSPSIKTLEKGVK